MHAPDERHFLLLLLFLSCLVFFCRVGLLDGTEVCKVALALGSIIKLLYRVVLTIFGTVMYYALYPFFALFSSEPPFVHW